jgi:fructokinase
VRIGIDLGGTKIEGIAIDDSGNQRFRTRIETPRGDYHATLDAIVGLVGRIESETGATGTIGVGIPGTIAAATGLVKNANSTWLNGQPLADDLPRLLERPVRFANDANCFALSEATDGAGVGARVVFGVILGTGTGGGLVIDGQVSAGANGITGEWGHNPMPWPHDDEWPGPKCYCGLTGCIETFLSGPALTRDFESASGRRAAPRDIVAAAAAGDGAAVHCLERYEDRLARALASVVNIIDPDVIVLGGGLSNIDRLYASIPRRWTVHVFSDAVVTRVVRAQHGDSSGVRGAAWLWNPIDDAKSDTKRAHPSR